MHYTITEHFTKYYPEKLTYTSVPNEKDCSSGLIIKVKLNSMPNSSERQKSLKYRMLLKLKQESTVSPKHMI